jgi:putative membrane protein
MIIVIGSLVFVGDVFAQERYYEWRWQMHPMWWGVWGIGMMLMMFLFWLLVVAALVIGIRWLVGKGKSQRSDRALEILRERYARGEINKDEFEAKQKDLSS